MRPSLKWAKLFFSSVSRTFCGTTINLGRLIGNKALIILHLFKLSWYFDRDKFYLVDISKRSLTELTLHPEAPHLSSSCSQSETDSHQFMWESRGRLLRNCFISGGRVIQRRHVLHIWVSGGARAAFWCENTGTSTLLLYQFKSKCEDSELSFFLLVNSIYIYIYTHWKNSITQRRKNKSNHMECL